MSRVDPFVITKRGKPGRSWCCSDGLMAEACSAVSQPGPASRVTSLVLGFRRTSRESLEGSPPETGRSCLAAQTAPSSSQTPTDVESTSQSPQGRVLESQTPGAETALSVEHQECPRSSGSNTGHQGSR